MIGNRSLILLLITSLLSACSTTYVAPVADRSNKTSSTHRVVRGETLYSIAWTYGLDYRELSAWNSIGKGYAIYPGQTLRLKPPTKQTSSKRSHSQQQNSKKNQTRKSVKSSGPTNKAPLKSTSARQRS